MLYPSQTSGVLLSLSGEEGAPTSECTGWGSRAQSVHPAGACQGTGRVLLETAAPSSRQPPGSSQLPTVSGHVPHRSSTGVYSSPSDFSNRLMTWNKSLPTGGRNTGFCYLLLNTDQSDAIWKLLSHLSSVLCSWVSWRQGQSSQFCSPGEEVHTWAPPGIKKTSS